MSAYDRCVPWGKAHDLLEEVHFRLGIRAYERHERRRQAHLQKRPVERLTLNEYRELLTEVPKPSSEQVEDFAHFVATAHSWYKHLPLLPPGVPMTFFLDPGAGMQRIIDRHGRARQIDRLEPGFHYSWRPTAEYRTRFGHAAYASSRGTQVSLLRGGAQLVPSDFAPLIFEPSRGELVALPNEIAEAGVAFLTAVVHPRASYHVLWRRAAEADASPGDWPAESGGAAALAQIIDRVQALRTNPKLIERAPSDPDGYLDSCDFVLYRLLTPERERQRREIVVALGRVIGLVR
jgi:hypothetical protein